MIPEFSVAENNMICLYNPGTRQGLIAELELMQPYLTEDEKDLLELVEGLIEKLEEMEDWEFRLMRLDY